MGQNETTTLGDLSSMLGWGVGKVFIAILLVLLVSLRYGILTMSLTLCLTFSWVLGLVFSDWLVFSSTTLDFFLRQLPIENIYYGTVIE